MIKLIVSDMDGTLLNDDKQLPHQFDEMLDELKKRNIKFCAGSGRQFQSLRRHFEKHVNDMVFISDNGTFVYEGEDLVFANTMSDEETKLVMERLIPYEVPLMMSGTQGAHRLDFQDQKIIDEVSIYYAKQIIHKSYDEVDDKIGKVALLDFSTKLHLEHLFDDKEHISIVHSGDIWWDVMSSTINKGVALQEYMNKYNIQRDEVIVFGDYMNDYEMLEAVDYSFAMANAVERVKAVSNFMAPSNNEEGVMIILQDVLEGTFEKKWQL